MKRNSILISFFVMVVQTIMAGVPDGYYTTIDGENHLTLKSRLYDIIKDHKVLGYSSLWTYYPVTYYHLDDKTRVLDMYSDIERHYSGTTVVGGMNKEHTVPKSWWGGSTEAAPGNDLFNVIPSDQTANGAKSNYPLGIVSGTNSFDNGVTKVGEGTVNGYSGKMFEPKDEYKGDFARIYLYMATCYPDIAWDTNNALAMTNDAQKVTLKDWIIPLLLKWNNDDPVDKAEVQRNEDIYTVQGNRNPFIDYPELAEYIWGTMTNQDFDLCDHTPNTGESTAVLRAGYPDFSVKGGTQASPYNIAEGTVVTIKGGDTSANLFVRVNGGEWKEHKCSQRYNSTSDSYYFVSASTNVTIDGDTHIEAYCTMEERANSDTLSYWFKAVNFSNDYLLYDAFDDVNAGDNTTTSGSSSKWSGNDNFPTLTNVYCAGNALRFGTSSKNGSMTSREISFAGGSVTVTLDVKGWSSVEGKLNVSMTGAEAQTVTYSAKMTDNFETVTLKFNNVSANPQLTIGTSAKRAFIDNIKVTAKESTAINDISLPMDSNEYVVYDLEGKQVSTNAKGIVIIRNAKGKATKVKK